MPSLLIWRQQIEEPHIVNGLIRGRRKKQRLCWRCKRRYLFYEGVGLTCFCSLKMRRLTKKKALTLVKELDAFPKVPESYVESTASGGTGTNVTTMQLKFTSTFCAILIFMLSSVSLIAFSLMAVLAFLEFFVYRDTWMKYEYEVDKDFGR